MGRGQRTAGRGRPDDPAGPAHPPHLIEVTAADSPTGERFLIKERPKDDEARSLAVSATLVERLNRRISTLGLRPGRPAVQHPVGRADLA